MCSLQDYLRTGVAYTLRYGRALNAVSFTKHDNLFPFQLHLLKPL